MQQDFWVFLYDEDEKPVKVKLLKTIYNHESPVTYIIQYEHAIYEFHGTLYYEDPGCGRYGWWVPQSIK